jgi:arginase
MGKEQFPIVLGGDCSILIGCMLALRRLGKYGLFFIDGHADFYQPEAEPNGEVASMELAIVSGSGPSILTDIDGLKPLVQDKDIIAFGYRDTEEQKEYASQDIQETSINAFTLNRCIHWEALQLLNKLLIYYKKINLTGSGFTLMLMCWITRLCPRLITHYLAVVCNGMS